jgi:hypothetical protein
MKRLVILLSIFSIGSVLKQTSSAAPNAAPPNAGLQIGFFYSSLSPHGEWIEVESGFRVWRPFNIPHQWRPYLIGRWVWTDDYGWYWMSDEPFGWITYHYGRWYFDDYYGWIWMPDDIWGPAWVEWRYDNDYIGWAPLPPYAMFQMTVGIHFTTHWSAPEHYWNFIRYHRFGSVLHYRDTAPIEHTRRLIRTSRSGPYQAIDHDRIINRGVDRSMIERRGNVRISRVDVQENHERSGERMIQSDKDRRIERIEVYRPSRDEMQRNPERIEARRGDHALSIDMNKIERNRRDQVKPNEQQPDRTNQREVQSQDRQRERTLQREERPREHAPRVQDQNLKRDRKEMRRELIQRHESKQNPSPPSNREAPQQKIERRRESSSSAQPHRSTQERRSSRSGEKRRDE